MSKASPSKSMAPGSSVPDAATATSSHAAGKQRETDKFTIAKFLEESTAMLDKIKHTAANVTTCQCQIDQVFDRAGSLLESLSVDSKGLDHGKLEAAGASIEETLKDIHKHVLRFAIYGRPKAFVTRDEISSYFEGLNVQIDAVYKSFAIAKHPDVENWEGEYYQAKFDDEAASYEQLWEILNNESDLKIIMEMGKDSVEVLKAACALARDYPHTDPERKIKLEFAFMNLERYNYDPRVLIQPSSLLREPPPKNPVTSRLAEPAGISRASSSTSTRGTSTAAAVAAAASQRPPPFDPDPAETPGARAKREEAERERALAMASGNADGYDEPTLPRWEPRRPPPGRGPGSIDETMDAAKTLGGLTLSEEQVQVPAPGWEPPRGEVPEDAPPGYS